MDATQNESKRRRWWVVGLVASLGLVAMVAPRFAQTQSSNDGLIPQPPVITVIFDTSNSSQWTEHGYLAYPEMAHPGTSTTDPDHHLDTWHHEALLKLPGSSFRNEDGEWESISTAVNEQGPNAEDHAIQSVGPCMVWHHMKGHEVGKQWQQELPEQAKGYAKGFQNCQSYVRPHMCSTPDGCDDRGYDWKYSDGMEDRLEAMVEDRNFRLNDDSQTPRHILIKQILTGDMRLNYDPDTGEGDGPGCWFVPRARGALSQEQVCCRFIDEHGRCSGAGNDGFSRYIDYNAVVPHYQEVWDEQLNNGLLDAFGTTALFTMASFDGYRDDGTRDEGWRFPMHDALGGSSPYSSGQTEADCVAGDSDCHRMGVFRFIGPSTYDIDRIETSQYTRYVQEAILDAGFLWHHESAADAEDMLLADIFAEDGDTLDVFDYPAGQQPIAEASPFGAVFHDLHQFYRHGQNQGALGDEETADPNSPESDDYFACRARHSVLFTDGTGIGPEAAGGAGNEVGYLDVLASPAHGYDEEAFPYLPAERAIGMMLTDIRGQMEAQMPTGESVDPAHYPRVHIMAAGIESEAAGAEREGYGFCTHDSGSTDPNCSHCCLNSRPCGNSCTAFGNSCNASPGTACWAQEHASTRRDIVEKLSEMAHAGETCAQYYLPAELLPGEDRPGGPIFNGAGAEGTCGNNEDPNNPDTCLVMQNNTNTYYAPQPGGETEEFVCEHPALILEREDRRAMEMAFRAVFNEVAGLAGVQSPTRPSITNHVDRLDADNEQEPGQYRIYSGYRQDGDNPHWQGLLAREFIGCGDTGVIDPSAGEVLSLSEELNALRGLAGQNLEDDENADVDRRRVFTSMPLFAGGDAGEATVRYGVFGQNFAGDVFGETLLGSDEEDHRIAMHRHWLIDELRQHAGYTEDEMYNYFNISGEDRAQEFDEVIDHLRGRHHQRSDRVLGAIRYSNPVTVGPPYLDLAIDSYRDFRRRQANRPTMTYVSTLDGQLRAIYSGEREVNTHTGEGSAQNSVLDRTDTTGDTSEQREAWAYVPAMLHQRFAEFSRETNPDMLMDGSPRVRDIRLCPRAGTGTGVDTYPDPRVCPSDGAEWRTVLVQGMDLAGRGYFALDVTRPGATDDDGDAQKPDPTVLWEFSNHWEGIQIHDSQMDPQRYRPQSPQTTECSDQDIQDVINAGRLCEQLPQGANSPGCDGLENRIEDVWDLAFLGSTIGEPEMGMVSKQTGPNNNPVQRPVAVFGAGTSERAAATLPYSDFEISSSCSAATSGRAIYVVDLQSGRLIRRFVEFDDGSTIRPFDTDITGTPVLSGSDPGDLSTRGFIGDANGNMYRIDMSSSDPLEWSVKLFFDPSEHMSDSEIDPDDLGPAAFRPAVTTTSRRELVLVYGLGQQDDTTSTDTLQAVIAVREEFDGSSHNGERLWIQEFLGPDDPKGERLTGPPVIFNNDVYFTTFVEPADACMPGRSRIYRMRYDGDGDGSPEGNWDPDDPQFEALRVDHESSDYPSKWIQPRAPTLIRGMAITMGPTCEQAAADALGQPSSGSRPQLVAQTGGADLADGSAGEASPGSAQAGAGQVGGIGQVTVDLDVPQTSAIPLSWTVLEQ